MEVKLSETRKTGGGGGGDLLIFTETEGDSKKIYESLKREDSGLRETTAAFRQPKSQYNAKETDYLSVVATDVDTRVREEEIEAAILDKKSLKVKVIRLINRASRYGIPKVKVTYEKKKEMEQPPGTAVSSSEPAPAELKNTGRK